MLRNFSQEFEKLEQSPRIAFKPVDVENEQSRMIKKPKKIEDKNSKTAMISQLEQILKVLADVTEIEMQEKAAQFKDSIIERLQNLQKKAQLHDNKEIQKLCMLAIGKRILNIELKKKREQFERKQQKKSQIDEYFRQNRIKKFDYDTLISDKLLENTLIIKPYDSGKGFNGSGNNYIDYQSSIIQCDFVNVVRKINKIFFDIFSGKKKDQKAKLYDILFKILWVPVILFLGLIITLPVYSFGHEKIILTILMSLIMGIITFIAISTYLNVPNNNNQIQQSIVDTKQFFRNLNEQNYQDGKQFEWICPDNFMYLEVKFFKPLK